MSKSLNRFLGIFLLLLSSACTTIPDGVDPINNFELDRYLGTWYEIARLDHRFERGLSHVTADYSLQESGQVRVINSGLGDDYDYAFVAGNNKKYLWLLARTPNPAEQIINRFLSETERLGFPTDELIFVDQQPKSP